MNRLVGVLTLYKYDMHETTSSKLKNCTTGIPMLFVYLLFFQRRQPKKHQEINEINELWPHRQFKVYIANTQSHHLPYTADRLGPPWFAVQCWSDVAYIHSILYNITVSEPMGIGTMWRVRGREHGKRGRARLYGDLGLCPSQWGLGPGEPFYISQRRTRVVLFFSLCRIFIIFLRIVTTKFIAILCDNINT